MKSSVWLAAAVACVASAAVHAARADKGITVTGCVQNFSSTGASGTTERGFLLSDAQTVVDPAEGAVGTEPSQTTTATGVPTGTSGTAAAGTPASGTWPATTGTMMGSARTRNSYRLDAGEQDLKEHVGHKVEVTGVVEPRKQGAPTSEADRLQVASVRMIATECSK
ncbi:MAG: hypothetical protein JWL71_2338 [Acidobacteria bacterium]|nr:hypothetical protein [Acidobacteriota bacterium]